jgi:hypothetical protein
LYRVARHAVEHRRGIAIGAGVFVAAAIAFLTTRRSAGYWAIDDAAITYAAAFQYADHGTLATSFEGTPVESYSNPLVFFVVVALRWLGLFDPLTSHLRVEMLLFALMAVLVWSLLRRLTGELAAVIGAGSFVANQLIATSTWVWYGSGLENVWVATGLVTLLWLCVRTARGVPLAPAWGIAAFLVALTRPEAPVYVAGFYVALAMFARPPELGLRAHARQVAIALSVTALLYVGFWCWRRISYGDWLANTYYAKIVHEPKLLENLRVSVIQNILLYARNWQPASAALVLLFVPPVRRIAAALLVLTAASLALPLTAGEDWGMGGGQRFSTPFLAMSHASLAMLAAVCVAGVSRAPRRAWRVISGVGLVVVLALTTRLFVSRMRRAPVKLNEVTISLIASTQGGVRWEHQMRLGVPYSVTMIPDAGGSALVGGMQMVDNAYLADFVLSHMGRYFGEDPPLLRQVNQYQHEERRPDLIDHSTAIGVIDPSYVGTRYLAGTDHLHARRDLVLVPAIDAGARLLYDDRGLRVYLSGETVLTAVPGALVRCELLVEWTDALTEPKLDDIRVSGALAGGDGDEISLRPYQPGSSGIERRALLLQAPSAGGPAPAKLEIVRAGRATTLDGAFTLDVRTDDAAFARAAEQIVASESAMRAARRLAWLREQLVPRLGMTRFHRELRELRAQNEHHGSRAGENVLQMRWNARLATFERVPTAVRTAEVAVARRLFAAAPRATAGEPSVVRVAYLGRVVDELRRLGYLGVLARVPEIADELSRARDQVSELSLAQRYQALVGLTLADPSSVALQRELIVVRRALERYPELPAVTDRAAR